MAKGILRGIKRVAMRLVVFSLAATCAKDIRYLDS